MTPSIRTYAWSLLLTGVFMAAGSLTQARAAATPEAPADRERKLIAVLESDAGPAEKAITCKKLAVYGSAAAVPVLAPLLTHTDLSSWARIALEAIPGAAADEALRDAMGKVQGRLLVGVINSVGHRRDAKAVPALAKHLKDADSQVAEAAAAALGSIGGAEPAGILEQALATAPASVKGEVAGACVRCAERFLAEGKKAEAIRLYDLTRQASVPRQRVLEATRGAILARGAAGLPLLVEQLKSQDKATFGIGLRTARELAGPEVTQAVAAEMDRAPVDRQTLLVMVLADRGDATVLPTIRKAAQTGPKPMRLAAITALERMGVAAGVPVLLGITAEEDRELTQAAKAALVRLPGREVNAELMARLPDASGKSRRALIEVLGQRRVADALPAVLACMNDADAGIRSAALTTVGILGEEKQAVDLVALLEKAQTPRDREDIEKALLAITSRAGAKCLDALLPLVKNSNSELRMVGLHTLASVGGAQALAAVQGALQDKDEAVQDEAVRTLATWPGNWPEDTAVAEPLLALAKSGKKTSHQVLGLRGYLEYVQADKKLKDEDKVNRVRDLLPQITRPEEKRLAIAALGTAPTAASIEMVLAFANDNAVAEEACLALCTLAASDNLKGATKELRQNALQTAATKAKTGRTKRRAQEALNRLQ